MAKESRGQTGGFLRRGEQQMRLAQEAQAVFALELLLAINRLLVHK